MIAATVALTVASIGTIFLMFHAQNDELRLAAILIGCFLCPVIVLADMILLPVSWSSGKETLSKATRFLPALRPQPGERTAAQLFRIIGALITLVYLVAFVLCLVQLNLTGVLFCLLRILHLVCLLSILLTALK